MPLLWLSLAFFAGILKGAAIKLPILFWGVTAVIASIFTFIEQRWLRDKPIWQLLRRWLPLPVALVVPGLCGGGLRWQPAAPIWQPADLAYHNGATKAELVGWVNDYPDQREGAVLLRVRIESIQPQAAGRITVKGAALLRL